MVLSGSIIITNMAENKKWTKEMVMDFLVEKSGYLKEGATRLALRLGVSGEDIEMVAEALTEARLRSKGIMPSTDRPAKILVFDIETAPMTASVWSAWMEPGLHMLERDHMFMLTWSAKWLFEDEIMSGKLTQKEVLAEDDSRITREIWHLLNEADIVISHNGDKYDIKFLNMRFILNELMPPMPYASIDTLKATKKKFKFASHKLDYINKQLGLTPKLQHEGFEMWRRCLKGDMDAMNKMEEYNIQDIEILEELYLKIRPWIAPHPNLGMYILDDDDHCPSCQGTNLDFSEKKSYYTNSAVYEAFRCTDCKSIGKMRRSHGTCNTRPLSK